MNGYVLVFMGAGLGGVLRHGANGLISHHLPTDFPLGTMLVNITGSLLLGILAGWLAFKGDAAQSWRLFLATGVLGGFTTFSAFSLDVIMLYERGAGLASVAAYLAGSVALAVAGLATGLWIVRHLA